MFKKAGFKAFLLTVMLCVLVCTAAAAETAAKIGATEYETLDAAVAAAASGDTITLTADCTLTKIYNKDLTFTGSGKISVSDYTYNNGFKNTWKFDGAGVSLEWVNGKSNWLMWSLGTGTLWVDNGATVTFRFDSTATRSNCALYVTKNSAIKVTNNSKFYIYGKTSTTTVGSGIQSDSANGTKIEVTGNSTFLIDGTNRGYVCSPNVLVEDSTFTVQNCTSNASNGGIFVAKNSTVNFENNTGHGLSVDCLESVNSTFNCNDNGYYGITVNTAATTPNTNYTLYIDATSVINANRNGKGYIGGGLRVSKADATAVALSGSIVNIQDNLKNGLENYATFKFGDGVSLTITGNTNTKDNGGGIYNGATGNLYLCKNATVTGNYAKQTGGGICNAGIITMGSDVKLCNNHADTAGDDVYNREGATIALNPVGSWKLIANEADLGAAEDACDPDSCFHNGGEIDGWYEDTEENRWNAHASAAAAKAYITLKAAGEDYIVTVPDGILTGSLGIKAAHDLEVPKEPDPPADPEPPKDVDPPVVPKTGDSTPVSLLIALASLSGLAMVCMKKRK